MAGDWIKMRTDLYRDPKVCVMADFLIENDRNALRNSDVTRDVTGDVTQNVTRVTRSVTRNACVGALLSVWGVVRHRGKRGGDDLFCDGVTLSVVDDISEVPGFGAAMQSVGWVVVTPHGIKFPRFFEDFNADPSEKSRSSAAQRQARYRASRVTSRVAQQDRNATVTRDVTVAPREEKRREEKKEHSLSENVLVKPKRKAFVPPTVEEVRAFCAERGNSVDAEQFVAHYESQGWKKSNGQRVINWQACVVSTWEKNNGRSSGGASGSLFATPGGYQGGGGSRNQQRIAGTLSAAAEFLADDKRAVRRVDGQSHVDEANDRVQQARVECVVRGAERIPVEGSQSGCDRSGPFG